MNIHFETAEDMPLGLPMIRCQREDTITYYVRADLPLDLVCLLRSRLRGDDEPLPAIPIRREGSWRVVDSPAKEASTSARMAVG